MTVNEKSNTQLSGFYVIYNGSTQHETNGTHGISHLLEHLMHNRNSKMYSTFDRYGITHNAFTSSTDVVFHITGLDSVVNKFKYDFLNNLKSINIIANNKYAIPNSLTKQEFEKEKKIVIQEYLDNFNDQALNHHDMFMREYLNYYGAIGDLTDLQNITYEDVINHYNTYMVYPTTILNISKNYPIEKKLDTLSPKSITPLTAIVPTDFKLSSNFNKVSILGVSNIVTEDFDVVDFIISMLSNGLNSPLYKIIREKYNLAYYIDFYIEPVRNNQGVITFQVLTDTSKNANKIIQLFEYMLKHPDKFITSHRYKLIKDTKTIANKIDSIYNHLNVYPYLANGMWDFESNLSKISMKRIGEVYNKYFHNFIYSITE